ncbi:MAG: hypothetical protein WHV44_08215 [Anaerolineales bacterium]
MNFLEQLRKPVIAAVFAGLVGIILGLLWGYYIAPLEWVDADPSHLRQDFQSDYLRLAIDSYAATKDEGMLMARYKALGPDAPVRLGEIVNNPGGQDMGAILKLVELAEKQPVEPPAESNNWLSSLLIIGAVLVLLVVLAAGAYYLFRRNTTAERTPAQQALEFSRSVEKTDFEAIGEEPPLAQYVATFVLGDDLFDDSFSIDAPSGEFLGECGVGISETIGVGDPKKVTAFEVWMFDKNDIQTVTKVLMSAHAFNDPAMRAKLESKGELCLVEPGAQVVLETATLQMVAQIVDMQYGESALPQGSFFERMAIELAIWPKK